MDNYSARWNISTSDDTVFDLAFSPRDQRLAVAYLQHLRIWDVEHQRIISARETSGGSSHGLIFSTDGTLLAHSVCCGSVSIWTMPEFTLRDELTTDRESAAAIAFVPHTSRLVAVDGTETLRLWQPDVGVTTIPHVAISGPLTFSPDGSHMIVTGRGEVQDRVIDTDSVKTVNSVSIPRPSISYANKLAFSPAGNRIAVMSDETLFELDYPSFEATELPGNYSEFVEDMAVSPAGDYLLSAHLLTGTRLWTTNGDLGYSLSNNSQVLDRVRIASDWSLMISSEAAGLVTRDPITDNQIAVMQNSVRNWYSIEISPSGQYVAAISDSFRLKLWDTSTGALIGETDAGYLASQLAFTPDSITLISEQADPTELRLWNTKKSGANQRRYDPN